MKFQIRKNEKVVIFSEVFATREEAEKHVSADDIGVSFIHESYAHVLGYPCGGFIVRDSCNEAKGLHVEAA